MIALQRPIIDYKPRCWRCGRVLGAYMGRPWNIKCQRCNALNYVAAEGVLTEAERYAISKPT